MAALMAALQIPIPRYVRTDRLRLLASCSLGADGASRLWLRVASSHGWGCAMPWLESVEVAFPDGGEEMLPARLSAGGFEARPVRSCGCRGLCCERFWRSAIDGGNSKAQASQRSHPAPQVLRTLPALGCGGASSSPATCRVALKLAFAAGATVRGAQAEATLQLGAHGAEQGVELEFVTAVKEFGPHPSGRPDEVAPGGGAAAGAHRADAHPRDDGEEPHPADGRMGVNKRPRLAEEGAGPQA